MRIAVGLGLAVVFSSCLSSGSSTKSTGIPVEVPQEVSATDLITGSPGGSAKQDVLWSFTPTLETSGVSFSVSGKPDWMSFNASTGQLSGVPKVPGSYNNISLRASKNDDYTLIGPFSVLVLGDPLREHQWHLENTQQNTFSARGGTALGSDVHALTTFSEGITGENILIAISDTGLQLNHPDLEANVNQNLSKDYTLSSPYFGDPSPSTLGGNSAGDHGTSVAGIIGAVGWNSIGVRGLAPGAILAGFNFLKSNQSDARYYDQGQGPYDIFNYSYGSGFYPSPDSYDQNFADIMKNGFMTARGGKGQVYVKSAGNSFYECDNNIEDAYNFTGSVCASHNSNTDNLNATPWALVVGAMNADGISSSYSSSGSNLWIAAPGGEDGRDEPAILTTDRSTCTNGYSRTNAGFSKFQQGQAYTDGSNLNPNCDYTHIFNGTSSAAPVVTAAVALLMEANPLLTARDIKHILAVTARKVHSNIGVTGHPNGMDLSGHSYEPGWVTNDVGRHYHNWYGFGALDVDAAVAMAKNYAANSWGALIETNAGFVSTSGNINLAVPNNSATGVTNGIYVSQNLTIEAVQIRINATHARPGELGIELTSPRGTKSVLMNINNALLLANDNSGSPEWVADLTNFVLLSNAFYGESSVGTWTVKVIDGLGTSLGSSNTVTSESGVLVNWSINIVGH